MGMLSDELKTIERESRFSKKELDEMFVSDDEKAALAHVTDALHRQTNDLVAMNELIQKGGAVLGVLTKVARKALGAL